MNGGGPRVGIGPAQGQSAGAVLGQATIATDHACKVAGQAAGSQAKRGCVGQTNLWQHGAAGQ